MLQPLAIALVLHNPTAPVDPCPAKTLGVLPSALVLRRRWCFALAAQEKGLTGGGHAIETL